MKKVVIKRSIFLDTTKLGFFTFFKVSQVDRNKKDKYIPLIPSTDIGIKVKRVSVKTKAFFIIFTKISFSGESHQMHRTMFRMDI